MATFDDAELRERFQYHAPDAEQLERLKAMREAAAILADCIMDNLPNCRERSLAITKLEECSMWMNKGAAFTHVES